jgi:hypothetical protein
MSDRADGLPKPDAKPTGEAAPAPSKRKRSLQVASLALVVLVMFAGLTLVVMTHRGAFNGTAALTYPDRLAALEARVNQLASSQSSGGTPAEATHLNERVDALEARLSMLESQAQSQPGIDVASRLATLEAEVQRAGDRETQSELLARVGRLESQNSGETLRRAGAVLALATLARATRDSAPFRTELDALAATDPNDPMIALLQPIAATGAPTTAMLSARFPQTARAALDAERRAGAVGFFSRLWAGIAGLVSIRPVGAAEGDTTGDRLARAESALNRNDLPTAVREVEALSGGAAMAVKPWLKDAQARLSVERAVMQMDSRIVQALASAPSQSGVP